MFSGSKRCSTPVTTFPKFGGRGRTSSLLDEELLLLGNDDLGIKAGQYISVHKPRDGLLAMKYSVRDIPLIGSPHRHTSLVSRNELAVLGGKFKSKGMLSKFTWTELSLHWENGTKFNADFEASCSVKVDIDVHVVFGGEHSFDHQRKSGRQVVKINTTEQIVYQMKPMSRNRRDHSCQILTASIALLSGGLDQSVVQPDEIYNITSEEVLEVLSMERSLGRTQHSLFRRGTQVFALGGKDSNDNATSKIAAFNRTTNAWEDLEQELFSSSTSELVVTPFPASALDCVGGCQCGVPNMKPKIYGGTAAEVIIQSCFETTKLIKLVGGEKRITKKILANLNLF